MAFNSMLRRASKSVLTLAVRGYGSPRAFHKAIPAVLSVEDHSLTRQIRPPSFLPFSHFATAAAEKPTADSNLIRVLESEIDCAEKPVHENNIPSGFPFEILDTPGERTITLTRRFGDEIIKVEVDMPNIEGENEDEDDDNGDNQDNEESSGDNIPLVVRVTKGNGEHLEFGITAFADEITIDSLLVKNPKDPEDQLAYEGPDFDDLDENLQNAFHKYLDIRAINPGTTNLLFEYMTNKDSREYLQWLQNLKNFVEN